jgi:hypothetical protein
MMQRKRREVVNSVLKEQHLQRSQGRLDEDSIRSMSRKASEWARSRALEIGNNDARLIGNMPTSLFTSTFAMDIDEDDSNGSMPVACGLSYDSLSSSEVSDDLSWAEKLMGEDLIPES